MENHLQNNVVSGVRPKLTVYLPRMFLTFLLCTFIATALNAQLIKPKLVFKNFSVDDGLLSNEVFHVIQDSTGYVWIATANGINRFNGVDFKTYNIEDGLIDNTIYEIYNDYKGRLWFISSSGRLVYIENDTIKHYPFNNKITDQLPITRGPNKEIIPCRFARQCSYYVQKAWQACYRSRRGIRKTLRYSRGGSGGSRKNR